MASKDYAHVETDKELAELESRIAQVYADAAAEMKVTVDDYFDSYAKRYEQYLNEYNAGNITKEEFQQWELNQIGRGERYEAMRDALANRFVNADEVAMAYVNDATPSIYSLNRNYSNYSIDQYGKSLIGFEPDFILWDESTVRNLIVNQPDLMPYYPESRAIQRGIDLAYGKSQITKAVTSGILQGKSLSKIARDLMNRIEGMSLNSALRAARTATTAAENAGRQDSYEEAADMGLKMEKVWLATLDSRTRVAHQQADMQVVGYDKTFDVGGESLMFPGDASHGASGWNLYNCRCTMFEKPEGMSMDDFKRWARDPETGASEQVTGKSYKEWLKDKQRESVENSSESVESAKILTDDEVSEKVNEFFKTGDYDEAIDNFGDDNGAQMRAITNSKLGYDALPEVLSEEEFEKAAEGKTEIYRGVHSNWDSGESADEIINELKNGALWTGNSGGAIYGNGIYFSDSTTIADQYASGGSNSAVAKAVLKDNAKIVEYSQDLRNESESIYKNIRDNYGSDAARLVSDEMGVDVGQISALRGYDAIHVPNAIEGVDYYVILNRGAVIMEE